MDLDQVQVQANRIARQLIAERCRVDLYYLCAYILGGEDIMDPKVHGPLCRAARPLIFYQNPAEALKYEFPSDYGRTEKEGMPSREEKIAFLQWQEQFEPNAEAGSIADKFDVNLHSLLALMPRGTLKSTVITIGLCIQWHLNFPEDRVLLDSETFTKSKAFLNEIKGHYEDNEKLREVFFTIHGVYPDARRKNDTWATEAIVLACRKRKRKESSIECAGIDVTKNGMHYDLVIMDDLHSEKNTQNSEQIEQVKMHYRLVYSLLDPGRPSVVVGTRWNDDDLYQLIIDTEQHRYNFITRSAESSDGQLFYPQRLPRNELDNFRQIQGNYIFSCQYLNNPVDNETAEFKRSNFHYVSSEYAKESPINWYGLVDPSYKRPGTTGTLSDYTAIVIGGMDYKGEIYCRYVFRSKMSYAEIIDKMFQLDTMFGPIPWLLEVIGTKSLEHDLEQAQIRASLEGRRRLKVHLVRHRVNSKEDRIKALSPYYERGHAHHVQGASGIDVLENELIRFPRAKNDDASDAWSGILEIGQRPRVDLPEPVLKKRKTYIKMLNKPRSPMVGY